MNVCHGEEVGKCCRRLNASAAFGVPFAANPGVGNYWGSCLSLWPDDWVPGIRNDFLVAQTARCHFPSWTLSVRSRSPALNFFFLTNCSLFPAAKTVLLNFSTLTP